MAIERLGPYKIQQTLGRGGMGTVYAGVNESSGETAAVKVLSSVLATNDAFRERFEAEIETLKTLKHPNIVQLYGYGEQDGHLFYVMELVDGTSLEEELQNGRRFQWREAIGIGIDVCRALKHAHDTGVIHRDLKPANLLINKDDKVKLTDFGIAKLFGHSQFTVDGGVLGTADYMAPEQAEGESVSPRSDLYSLGSVLYALLAGRPPFRGKSLTDVLHMLRFSEPVPVRTYAPDVPRALDRIISQLLDKDPRKRIPTALALSNVLQATEHALSLDKGDDSDANGGNLAGREQAPTRSLDSSSDIDSTSVTRANSESPLYKDQPTAKYRSENTSAEEASGSLLDNTDSAITADPDSSATANHFTTVDERDLGRPRDYDLIDSPHDVSTFWLKLAMAVVVLLAVTPLVWYLSRPPSADRLFKQIKSVADEDDIVPLSNINDKIELFLDEFPDDSRHSQVQDWSEKVALHRSIKSLEFRAKQLLTIDSLTPVELAYLESIQERRTNPERTAARLTALINVYGGQSGHSDRDKMCLELANRQLTQLRIVIDRSADRRLDALHERLQHAAELMQSKPDEAIAIYRGIIDLYQEKPWAGEVVKRAQHALDQEGE